MSIFKKLLKIQSELNCPKNSYNKFGNYHYRSAEAILEAVKPICLKYNCAIFISDSIKQIGDRYYVEAQATLVDTDVGIEEFISTTALAREETEKKGMDASQITGAASSYARKYALNGLLAIDDAKDADGLEPDKPTQKSTASKAPISSAQYAKENKEDKSITEAQRKRLFAIGNEADIRAVMAEYKIEHTTDIPMSKYDEICKKVEAMKNARDGK